MTSKGTTSRDEQEEYLGVVELACDRLDAVEEYGTNDATGLVVLHGLTLYARDTARAAALLLRGGHTLQAAALSRVVLEHGVLAQWLKADPEERGRLFVDQAEVEHDRWFEVVLDAALDPDDPVVAALTRDEKERGMVPKPKNVAPEFDTAKNLFGDTENGRQLYLTYRNLSGFVHPSMRTFGRYTKPARHHGLSLANKLNNEQAPEAVAFYLASSLALCAMPYFDALGEVAASAVLGVAARTAHVITSLD